MTSPSPLLHDTYYHIYNRGVNRGNIFFEERNYELFLRLYERHLAPVTDLFAYCLLKNHFHLAMRVKSKAEIFEAIPTSRAHSQNNPLHPSARGIACAGKPVGAHYVSTQFSNFFNAYARIINKAYGRTGSLFQHPFGRVAITTNGQFWNVIAYIHQNPQKHGFVRDFREWKYSSYEVILTGEPTVIQRSEVMKWFGTRENYISLHSQWVTDAQAKWFHEDDFD